MEGERGRASSLGPGARAGSLRAKVCVYMCLRVCAHAQTDTKLLAGVGSVAGLLCPLAQGSGGHCGDHVCPGPLHCPWGPGPRLPTCRPLGGVTGPALQVGDQSCLRQRRLGRAQHGTMGEGAGVGAVFVSFLCVAERAPNIPFCTEGFPSLLLSLCCSVANLLEFLTWLHSRAQADRTNQLRLCIGPTPPLIPEKRQRRGEEWREDWREGSR